MYEVTIITPDGKSETTKYERHTLCGDVGETFKWLKNNGKTWIRIVTEDSNVLYQIRKQPIRSQHQDGPKVEHPHS